MRRLPQQWRVGRVHGRDGGGYCSACQNLDHTPSPTVNETELCLGRRPRDPTSEMAGSITARPRFCVATRETININSRHSPGNEKAQWIRQCSDHCSGQTHDVGCPSSFFLFPSLPPGLLILVFHWSGAPCRQTRGTLSHTCCRNLPSRLDSFEGSNNGGRYECYV